MIENPQALAIASTFSNAMAQRDVATIADLYADDIVIWHNTTNKIQSKHDNLGLLTRIFDEVSEIGYHDIACLPTPQGFVQYHIVKARFHDGSPVGECFACLLMKVDEGKITHIDEWIDGSQFAKLWERLGAGSLAA